MRVFQAPDGTPYAVDVSNVGASNALIVFRHPDARHSGRDRYAHFLWHGPEARSVTARLEEEQVMEALQDADLVRLFRRSFPVSTGAPGYNPKVSSKGP